MASNNFLAIVSTAYGPMCRKDTKFIKAIRTQTWVDLQTGLENMLYSEVDRAERDKDLLERVGEIEGIAPLGYDIINEIFDFLVKNKNIDKNDRYHNKLENATYIRYSYIPFLPLKTFYHVAIYEIEENSSLDLCTDIIIESESSGGYVMSYPEVTKIIPVTRIIDKDGKQILEYLDYSNNLICKPLEEIKESLNNEGRTLVEIKDYTDRPNGMVITEYKPTGNINLSEVKKIIKSRYRILDLSEAIMGVEKESWSVFLGYSHSGPVYGSSGVRDVEIFRRLLEKVTADTVILPDNVARRHLNTILDNKNIKKVKVSENCKLFSMVGEDLYNKKGTILMFKVRD